MSFSSTNVTGTGTSSVITTFRTMAEILTGFLDLLATSLCCLLPSRSISGSDDNPNAPGWYVIFALWTSPLLFFSALLLRRVFRLSIDTLLSASSIL